MPTTEEDFRIAEAALKQAVRLDLEAEVAFVHHPSPTTEQAYRNARSNLATSVLELNDKQYARLVSAATMAQFAKAIMDELQSEMQEMKATSRHNNELLREILTRLDRQAHVVNA